MSAATMIACAANKIVMGLHSSLGPIDPQLLIPTQLGLRMIPAQAILDQFHKAQADCRDPVKLGPWMPILGQYGPALLVECENAIKLSRYLVKKWLAEYMFAGMPKSKYKAALLARKLADHRAHMSHSRHLNLQQCKSMGFNIEELEKDRDLQDLVLSVFHVTTHTFNLTPAVKIIENHAQKAFIKVAGTPVPVVVGRQPHTPAPTSPAELSPSKPSL